MSAHDVLETTGHGRVAGLDTVLGAEDLDLELRLHEVDGGLEAVIMGARAGVHLDE